MAWQRWSGSKRYSVPGLTLLVEHAADPEAARRSHLPSFRRWPGLSLSGRRRLAAAGRWRVVKVQAVVGGHEAAGLAQRDGADQQRFGQALRAWRPVAGSWDCSAGGARRPTTGAGCGHTTGALRRGCRRSGLRIGCRGSWQTETGWKSGLQRVAASVARSTPRAMSAFWRASPACTRSAASSTASAWAWGTKTTPASSATTRSPAWTGILAIWTVPLISAAQPPLAGDWRGAARPDREAQFVRGVGIAVAAVDDGAGAAAAAGDGGLAAQVRHAGQPFDDHHVARLGQVVGFVLAHHAPCRWRRAATLSVRGTLRTVTAWPTRRRPGSVAPAPTPAPRLEPELVQRIRDGAAQVFQRGVAPQQAGVQARQRQQAYGVGGTRPVRGLLGMGIRREARRSAVACGREGRLVTPFFMLSRIL